MIRVSYIVFVLILFSFHQSYSQQKTPLKVGDMMPDIKIEKIFNDPKRSAVISDYKDKLLILDFGFTSCTACVEALPRMNNLQKEFNQKIKIFWITNESEAILKTFWQHNRLTKNLTLPVIVEDRKLNDLFKHKSDPHEVWIYKGKIIAITQPEYVDAGNIKKVLSGDVVNWPVKNDYYVFNPSLEPLFRPDSNQIDIASTSLKYAAVSDYKNGVSTGAEVVKDAKRKTIRTYITNQSIYNSYVNKLMDVVNADSLIKPSSLLPEPNQIVWNVIDRSKYIYEPGSGYMEDWKRKHYICFESLYPDTGQNDKTIAKKCIDDLNRLFGLHIAWERRKEKVFVLIRTTQEDRLKSKKTLTSFYDERIVTKGSLHQLRDIGLGTFVAKMNKERNNPYIFDGSNYQGKVDMDLNFPSWTAIEAIRKALKPYGLDLKEEEKLVDKLVFSEVDDVRIVDTKMISEIEKKIAAQKDLKSPSPEENNLFMMANKTKKGVVVLPSGLQYQIMKQGNGPKPELNSKVGVNYIGTLVNGKIFDSSMLGGKPFIKSIRDLIKGWQEALLLMPVGSKWKIYVPANLAYAEHTANHTIPPNSNLIFELELLKILK
ncbi:FKBP-type peptidyl-prolyl cis-trans isomerase [Pedobacter lusitanus]|uniref:FKBP-type peptidyl-prolyl cis-trans isomerase n=1 Tax=Pedobacter lusitanus TaxID=1503925 RepID=UPI000A804C97|nr:FKBP-type peptidyl-prolyl cis-trans isomerase [Pedobacter lusitanus]